MNAEELAGAVESLEADVARVESEGQAAAHRMETRVADLEQRLKGYLWDIERRLEVVERAVHSLERRGGYG